MGSCTLSVTVRRLPEDLCHPALLSRQQQLLQPPALCGSSEFTSLPQELQLGVLHVLEMRCQTEQHTLSTAMQHVWVNQPSRAYSTGSGQQPALQGTIQPEPGPFPCPLWPHSPLNLPDT